ncbi:MAG: hypothetical protein BYD32DRAFT_416353 [Podila humilis]|nr:MAG: hypothetical protein BYD32DRAFT_416353 [Podila humilis]
MDHNQERNNRIQELLHADTGTWVPRLFLVLIADVQGNNYQSNSIPRFRFYFLCETSATGPRFSNHVHVLNHPGYDLDRPLEFFNRFGHHTLTLLEMVKYGFSGWNYYVPTLQSANILCSHHSETVYHELYWPTIALLVDQTIAFIVQLNQQVPYYPKLSSRDMLDVLLYLKVSVLHDWDLPSSAAGDLRREVEMQDWRSVRWRCSSHARHGNDIGPIIPSIAQSGDTLNCPISTITLRLLSPSDATLLCYALQRTRHAFGANLTLAWNATNSELGSLVLGLSHTRINILQIDGVTPSVHPQGCFEDQSDVFLSSIRRGTIQLLSLLNYPRTSAQYVYLILSDVTHGLLLHTSQGLPRIDWSRLHDSMKTYTSDFHQLKDDYDFRARLHNLSKVLHQHYATSIEGIDIFGGPRRMFQGNTWQGRLGVSNCVVYGLSRAIFPNKVFSSPWLLRNAMCLLVRLHDLHSVLPLHALTENPTTPELEFLIQETEASSLMISDLYRRWNHQNFLRLTLVEKGRCLETRTMASFGIWNEQFIQKSIICLWWDIDGVSGRSWDATLLDAAVRRFPAALRSFTFDVSGMTDRRLVRIQSVLQRSNLEHLQIRCKPVALHLQDHVERVLGSVQWRTIKSLVLSGDDIDTWIQLWTKHGGLFPAISASGSQLLSLAIVGPTKKQHLFSHHAAVALHCLIYLNPLQELWLENVAMGEEKDWDLIFEAIDFSTLKTAHIHNTSTEFTIKFNTKADKLNSNGNKIKTEP